MPKDVIVTPEGLTNMKAELEHLQTNRRREVAARITEGYEKLKHEIAYLSDAKRKEVAERIKQAREFGDIAENAEYDDAKNEQAMLEARIAALEDKIRSASVIDPSHLSTDVVRVGSVVHVKDPNGKAVKYTIVGSAEAKPLEQKLSNESPVGKALLGHAAGDEVVIVTPKGERRLQITKIEVAR
jgi:transcription elongation factor GreA